MPGRKLLLTPAVDPFGQRLAICLTDLDRLTPFMLEELLNPRKNLDLRRESVFLADKERFDETGVPFKCDLLTAACICDTIRGVDRKVKEHPTRVYLFRSSWQKLPGATILSVVDGGKVKLNPQVFRVPEESVIPLAGVRKPAVRLF